MNDIQIIVAIIGVTIGLLVLIFGNNWFFRILGLNKTSENSNQTNQNTSYKIVLTEDQTKILKYASEGTLWLFSTLGGYTLHCDKNHLGKLHEVENGKQWHQEVRNLSDIGLLRNIRKDQFELTLEGEKQL